MPISVIIHDIEDGPLSYDFYGDFYWKEPVQYFCVYFQDKKKQLEITAFCSRSGEAISLIFGPFNSKK